VVEAGSLRAFRQARSAVRTDFAGKCRIIAAALTLIEVPFAGVWRRRLALKAAAAQ
jgi:hypothetical protein